MWFTAHVRGDDGSYNFSGPPRDSGEKAWEDAKELAEKHFADAACIVGVSMHAMDFVEDPETQNRIFEMLREDGKCNDAKVVYFFDHYFKLAKFIEIPERNIEFVPDGGHPAHEGEDAWIWQGAFQGLEDFGIQWGGDELDELYIARNKYFPSYELPWWTKEYIQRKNEEVSANDS